LAAYRGELGKWSRTAVAIGILFASLPVAGRLLFGVWGFPEAAGISGICFAIAVYLYARSVGQRLGIPDSAVLLDRAQQLVSLGRVPKAISVLTQAIRLDPNLWQAYEYRGRLRISEGNYSEALKDISEAIRLAPRERHLYFLRAQVYDNIGQETLAQQDYETANRLNNV
jgi:tetratricopeptide (TPR) repeat protein